MDEVWRSPHAGERFGRSGATGGSATLLREQRRREQGLVEQSRPWRSAACTRSCSVATPPPTGPSWQTSWGSRRSTLARAAKRPSRAQGEGRGIQQRRDTAALGARHCHRTARRRPTRALRAAAREPAAPRALSSPLHISDVPVQGVMYRCPALTPRCNYLPTAEQTAAPRDDSRIGDPDGAVPETSARTSRGAIRARHRQLAAGTSSQDQG